MGPPPGEEGLGRRRGSTILDTLLVPRDARGIVIACGFVAVIALGISALLLGDPIGYAYLAAAAVGYFFLQTRLVPAVLWLLISFGGLAGASAGNTSDWVVFGLGFLLAIASVLPPSQTSLPETSRKDDVAELELFSATISVTSSIQLTLHSEVASMMGLKAVEPKLYISFSLDSAVPSNHLVRRLAAAVDFGFIRSLVKGSYSHTGQPSVDPVVLFKLSLLGYLYGIRSERRVCEEAGLNLAWRWFLGYELDEPVPDHSVLSKARRRFGQAVYERFFKRILQLCEQRGLVEGDVVFLDSTLSRANASAKSLRSRMLVEQRRLTSPKDFVAELWAANDEEGPEDTAPRPRRGPGRTRKEKPERRAVVNGMLVSSTDPDAEVATRLGLPRLLSHKTHMVVDGGKAQIITAVEVRPATEGDAKAVGPLLTKHRLKLGRSPREMVADAGYASDASWNACLQLGVQPTIAMRPVLNRSGGLHPDKFTYIPERDLYICPEGKELGHKTLAFEKRRVVYRPKRGTCRDCPLKAQCAPGSGDRSITRRWEIEQYEAMKMHLQKRRSRLLLRRRKTVSERVFAHAKEQHGFGKAQFRGRTNMQIQALLTASAMNLKQLVRRRPEAQTGRALVVGQRPIPRSDRQLARCWRRPVRGRVRSGIRRLGPPSP